MTKFIILGNYPVSLCAHIFVSGRLDDLQIIIYPICMYFCLSVCVQVLKKIARFVKEQNEKVYAPRGLLLTDPIERGLRVVSFTALCHMITRA